MAAASVVGASDFLASAFSSTLGSTVVTYDQYKEESEKEDEECSTYFQSLDIDQLFKVSQLQGKFGDRPEVASSPAVGDGEARPEAGGDYADAEYDIYIQTLTRKIITVKVFSDEIVADIKEKVQNVEGIPPDQQRIIYHGQQLQDDWTLCDCNIKRESTLHLVLRLRGGGGPPTFYIDETLLDPKFDFDFTHTVNSGTKYYRGGYEYQRPYGWKRFAIKVLGRFENDEWLGKQGMRSKSSDGEWPVSYHGTGESATGSIAQDGYKLSKGKRFRFGKGIYSTPSITVAAKYARVFEHKGTKYKIVFQNRVCPSDLKIIDEKKTGIGEYWVTISECRIRPYGICIQKAAVTSTRNS